MSPPTIDLPVADPELVRLAAAGDVAAFGDLVSRHQQRLWMVCRQYLGEDLADSAAQEAFVKAFTRLASFDGRASFSTWLTRIAINTCLDILRKQRREGARITLSDDEAAAPLDLLADNHANPEERLSQRQAIARLARAERSLPTGQRTVFRLRFFAEMELEEIARVLGVHVGTVKTQLHRAVHKVRCELGDAR